MLPTATNRQPPTPARRRFRDTSDRDFLTASGTTTQVKMMRTSFRRHVGVQHTSRPGSYFAIGLPYKGGAFQAVAVLPERGVGMEAVLRLWATEEQVGRQGEVLVRVKREETRQGTVDGRRSSGRESSLCSCAMVEGRVQRWWLLAASSVEYGGDGMAGRPSALACSCERVLGISMVRASRSAC